MKMQLEYKVPNQLDRLTPLSGEMAGALREHGACAEAIYAAELALEELFTNIIKYGYDDDGVHEIIVRLEMDESVFRLMIEDDGHAFNPFDQPCPDLSVPLEERQIGGLGIHFICEFFERRNYERLGGRNLVTLEKGLQASA